jgi:hypothetical protein
MELRLINFVHIIHLLAYFEINHCFNIFLNSNLTYDFEFLNLIDY